MRSCERGIPARVDGERLRTTEALGPRGDEFLAPA